MAAEVKVAALEAENPNGRFAGRAVAVALDIVCRAGLYRPDLFAQYGEVARKTYSASTVEFWDLTEQTALAAADRGSWGVFERLLSELSARFPGSWRVNVVEARGAEMRGQFSAAMSRYLHVIAQDPMKSLAYKRQVAVLKSERKVSEAISLLNYYTSLFRGDLEAWGELCALCIAIGRYEHALFCANELIAQEPGNHAAHIVVADVHMTIAGPQNILSARRHYGASIHYKRRGNVRALYGMWLAATRLEEENRWKEAWYDEGSAQSRKAGGETKARAPLTATEKQTQNSQIIAWTQRALLAAYRRVSRSSTEKSTGGKLEGHGMLDVVTAALK